MADRVDLPVVFDDDNPEWTDDDFARARPSEEVLPPEVIAAFGRKRGRPPGSNKQQVALRIDKDVLERFRAGGAGWQSRMNDILQKASIGRGDLMAAARAQGVGARRQALAA